MWRAGLQASRSLQADCDGTPIRNINHTGGKPGPRRAKWGDATNANGVHDDDELCKRNDLADSVECCVSKRLRSRRMPISWRFRTASVRDGQSDPELYFSGKYDFVHTRWLAVDASYSRNIHRAVPFLG